MGEGLSPSAGACGPEALRRVLGPIDATCVVVGAIIGVGIFFTPSIVAATAGSATMAHLAWAVGGGIALCGALTFAELGARYPHAGGQYEILRDAYGPFPAFLFVFCNATATQSGAIAIIALVCTQNLWMAASASLPSPGVAVAVSVGLIVAVTVANAAGVRWGAGIQNFTVAAKLATLLIVALLAIQASPSVHGATAVAAPASGTQAISSNMLVLLFAAIVPSFFAYGGWQHALWIAGEVRDPRRTLPLAIIGGVIIVVAAYLLTNWAFLHLLGYDGVVSSGALASDAVARVWPTYGRRLTGGAVALSAFGVLNAQLLSGPRLIYRMAADGRFFAPFARISPHGRTPVAAIVLLGSLGLSLLLLASAFSDSAIDAIGRLTTGAVFIDGVFFTLTGLSLFVLRRRDAAREACEPPAQVQPASSSADGPMPPGACGPSALRASRLRLGYPVVPALFVLGEIGITLGAYANDKTRSAAYIGVAWIVGAAVLFAVRFRGARRGQRAGSSS